MNRFLILLTSLLAIGCSLPDKSYYVLSPEGPSPSGGGVGIGVGPVALAEYIDRPNLVVQQTSNQLGVAESHRWAGDLSQGISRVMAANLGRQMKSGNVRVYPWQHDDEINYQVTLDIRQLHSGEDGYAVIEAGWRVYSFPDRRLKASRTFVDREPLETSGYGPMVAAESRLLARLAKDIATGLR
ncbi:MAG: PqiC family protein [Luteolibacter sp.]